MGANKALGPNGILLEFFRCLWPTISEEFHAMISKAMVQGTLREVATEGLISCIQGRRKEFVE